MWLRSQKQRLGSSCVQVSGIRHSNKHYQHCPEVFLRIPAILYVETKLFSLVLDKLNMPSELHGMPGLIVCFNRIATH